MKRVFLMAVAGAALVAGQSDAAQITVGNGNRGNAYPYAAYGDGSIYEQVYFASNFGALPVIINA